MPRTSLARGSTIRLHRIVERLHWSNTRTIPGSTTFFIVLTCASYIYRYMTVYTKPISGVRSCTSKFNLKSNFGILSTVNCLHAYTTTSTEWSRAVSQIHVHDCTCKLLFLAGYHSNHVLCTVLIIIAHETLWPLARWLSTRSRGPTNHFSTA